MSTAPATAASQVKGNGARLRNLVIGALFAAVLLIPQNSPHSPQRAVLDGLPHFPWLRGRRACHSAAQSLE